MTEKVRAVSNPLTIIAIFAALAEINATVSIGLVEKDLQEVFIWFVILFPTILVLAFFLTLNFNTKVIYAPSDYQTDEQFHKVLIGEMIEPDKEINNDKEVIEKTLKELGIKRNEIKFEPKDISDPVLDLFKTRYLIEKEIRRLAAKHIEGERNSKRPLIFLLSKLTEERLITQSQQKAIRNIYSITSPAIHGEEENLTVAEIAFVEEVAPGIIKELKNLS